MIVSLIVEPRSGSTNLANTFFNDNEFTVLYLPSDPMSKWYTESSPKDYPFVTKHLMVKEDFYTNKDFSELLNISDKTIFLHRENAEDQIISWVNAKTTNNWDGQWKYNKDILYNQEDEVNYFKDLKSQFNKLMLDNPDSLCISYEDIYNRNGFDRIKEYLGEEVSNKINSPAGKRYRIDVNKSKSFI